MERNRRSKKPRLSLEAYFSIVEELLKLTNKEKKKPKKISEGKFKL